MPSGVFKPYAGVSTAILFFTKTNSGGTDSVWFAVVPKELEGANITQDTARFAITGANPVFVRECLRTPGLQRWMAKHTKGVAVRGINLGDVKLLPVIVPSVPEQQEFSRRAIAVGELINVHRTALADSNALFASLQHRAFSGTL